MRKDWDPNGLTLTILKVFLIKTLKPFRNFTVHWHVGYIRNCNLTLTIQYELLLWNDWRKIECIIWKKMGRCFEKQLSCERDHCYKRLISSPWRKLPRIVHILVGILGLPVRRCNTFENFLCKLWLIPVSGNWVILRNTKSVSIFKSIFQFSHCGLLYR